MSKPHLDHPDAFGMVQIIKRPHIDPTSVVNDRDMTSQEKREILADWASDRRAVTNHPSLRRLDSGHLVGIDAILDALKRLDEVAFPTPSEHLQRPGPRRPWAYWNDDDNDDPPPCPAAAKPWKPRPLLDATPALMVA